MRDTTLRPILAGYILLVAPCVLLHAAAASNPAKGPPILNVVLIELDTQPQTGPANSAFSLNDWIYWDRSSGMLIKDLVSNLGSVRGNPASKESDATLFALRASAQGLGDTDGLEPLFRELDEIGLVTGRPGITILWLPREQALCLSVYDRTELTASAMFAMLDRIAAIHECDTDMLQVTESVYVGPPMIVRGRVIQRHNSDLSMDVFLASQLPCKKLLHVLISTPVHLILDGAIRRLNDSYPAGAAMKAFRHDFDFAAKPAAFRQTLANIADIDYGPFGKVGGSPIVHGLFEMYNNRLKGGIGALASGDCGGILLAPKIEVVIDRNGLTNELATKAVAAVRGRTSGEFTHGDQTYLAVKAPGTANMFRVAAGQFRLAQPDMTSETSGRTALQLCRYYESASHAASPLGPGWSFQPFSLELSRKGAAPSEGQNAAANVTLIDRQTGVRLAYRLEKDSSTATQPAGISPTTRYVKLTSSLQPELEAHQGDGGYVASFAHGLRISFDATGHLLSMERPEGDRIEYAYEGDVLKELRTGSENRIGLVYDDKGRLSGARATGGTAVRYLLDNPGRLVGVSGSESGDHTFTYGDDGRLASVTHTGNQEPHTLVADNTYDNHGRMLTHRTPAGEWRFTYDDKLGRAVTTGPDGKKCEYYYDAFQRLVAYGAGKDKMTLLNYDVTGRILQVAEGQMLNEPSGNERPRFRVLRVLAPLSSSSAPKETKG